MAGFGVVDLDAVQVGAAAAGLVVHGVAADGVDPAGADGGDDPGAGFAEGFYGRPGAGAQLEPLDGVADLVVADVAAAVLLFLRPQALAGNGVDVAVEQGRAEPAAAAGNGRAAGPAVRGGIVDLDDVVGLVAGARDRVDLFVDGDGLQVVSRGRHGSALEPFAHCLSPLVVAGFDDV